MRKFPTTALLGSLLLTSTSALYGADNDPLLSDPPPQVAEQQLKGMGIGALLGTLLAGPVGTIAGSGFGSIAGWGEGMEQAYQQQNKQLTQLQQQGSQDQRQIAQQNTELNRLKKDYQALKNNSPLKPLLQALTLDIHFQTNSAVVEPHYYKRLQTMAEKLQQLPQIHLKLTGFADHRGDSQYNLNLARSRAEALASLLKAKGLSADQICIEMKGEKEALSRNNSGLLPFDRKVSIHFQFKNNAQH
ncbi:MAG: OmpA family protein [Motiliproteus sp.]|nr:OmpA family protein [Motiliproteus sp.]MCW9051664.1 OmpA family protein [Motiliproteus sp.]